MNNASGIAKVVTRIKMGEEEESDVAYWQAQSPEARPAALEEIRREYHLWKYDGEPSFRKAVTIIKTDGTVVRRMGDVEPLDDEAICADEAEATQAG